MIDRILINIRPEDLDLHVSPKLLDAFHEDNGDRKNLLTGSAPGNPGAEGITRWFVSKAFWQYFMSQDFECLRISEELGHPDEEIFKEELNLVGMFLKVTDISLDIINIVDVHPFFDPSVE